MTMAIHKDTMIIDGVRTFVRVMVWYMKNVGLILGALGLLLIDVITGPLFLGGLNPDGSARYSVVYWAASIGLTAIQMVMWDKAWQMKRADLNGWWLSLPVLGAVVFMAADTMLDVGFVTQMLVPDAGNQAIFPSAESRSLIWYLLVIIFGGCSLLFEVMLVWMIGERNPEARIKAELYDWSSDSMADPPQGFGGRDPLLQS